MFCIFTVCKTEKKKLLFVIKFISETMFVWWYCSNEGKELSHSDIGEIKWVLSPAGSSLSIGSQYTWMLANLNHRSLWTTFGIAILLTYILRQGLPRIVVLSETPCDNHLGTKGPLQSIFVVRGVYYSDGTRRYLRAVIITNSSHSYHHVFHTTLVRH